MKETIRKEMLKKRSSISNHEKMRLDEILHDSLYEFLKPEKDKIIALYYSIRSEVDTHKIINTLLAYGFIIALPAINEDDSLSFIKIHSLDSLNKGKFCLEPKIIISDIVTPDIIVIPLVAFDKNGNRIGYGKGYYDRALLNFSKSKKIGIAYGFQEIEVQNIYYNDVQLQCIITEQQIIYADHED